jgi:hypothetical protein
MIYALRPTLRTLCGAVLLTGLAGCMMASVKELPPPHYSIEGVWELTPALSSDPDKVLAAVQPKPKHGPGNGPGQGPGGSEPPPEVINDPTTDLPPIDTAAGREGQALYRSYSPNDRNLYRPPLDFQKNALLGGQWLKIRQSDTEVSIANAATNRSFTSGERSVVSVPSGVADQVAGWSGRDFLIDLRPQIGPEVRETYTLSPDGKQLVVKINVASEGRNLAMKVIRVYDRSTKDPALLHQTLQQTLPPPE